MSYEGQVEEEECVVCLDAVSTVVLLPCKHKCLCDKCYGVLKMQKVRCPLCRQEEEVPFEMIRDEVDRIHSEILEMLISDFYVHRINDEAGPRFPNLSRIIFLPIIPIVDESPTMEDVD